MVKAGTSVHHTHGMHLLLTLQTAHLGKKLQRGPLADDLGFAASGLHAGHTPMYAL